MRERMLQLAEKTYTYQGQTVDIMSFHEGMNGGINDRGVEMSADSYEGYFTTIFADKITGGGEDLRRSLVVNATTLSGLGNYEDIPDVQMAETCQNGCPTVPMLFLEMLAHYYGTVGIDNDGDGRVDEDLWGDANNDGVLDDDGDCLSLAAEYQDSNGDGNPCGR